MIHEFPFTCCGCEDAFEAGPVAIYNSATCGHSFCHRCFLGGILHKKYRYGVPPQGEAKVFECKICKRTIEPLIETNLSKNFQKVIERFGVVPISCTHSPKFGICTHPLCSRVDPACLKCFGFYHSQCPLAALKKFKSIDFSLVTRTPEGPSLDEALGLYQQSLAGYNSDPRIVEVVQKIIDLHKKIRTKFVEASNFRIDEMLESGCFRLEKSGFDYVILLPEILKVKHLADSYEKLNQAITEKKLYDLQTLLQELQTAFAPLLKLESQNVRVK